MSQDDPTPLDSSAAFEQALDAADGEYYILRLYVAGLSPRSQRAIASIKAVCQEHLAGRYELEVIDIYQKPSLAEQEQVVAVPTLLKRFPLPLRKIIGDLTNHEQVLFGLDLKARPSGG